MLTKKTALEVHRTQRQQRSLDWRLIFPVLAGLGIVIALLYSYQLAVIHLERSSTNALKSQAMQVVARLGKRIAELNAVVDELAVDENNVRALLAGKAARRAREGAIRAQIPNIERAILFKGNLLLLKPKPYPGINMATWDLMLRLAAGEKTPALEIQGGESRRARAEAVRAIRLEERKQPLGFLIADFPASAVLDAVQDLHTGSGRMDVWEQSDRYTQIRLARLGVEKTKYLASDGALRVNNSPLRVSVQPIPMFSLLSSRDPVAVGFGLAAGLALTILAFLLRTKYGRPRVFAAPDKGKAETVSEAEHAVEKTHVPAATVPPAVPVPEISPSLFRTYDIRGVVGDTLSGEIAEFIGQAVGSEALDRGHSEIAVGRDGRESGNLLTEALIKGLLSTGINVIDIGMVPTGVLYFATHHLSTRAGIMVTGSHNPPEYNGFKVVLDGQALYGEAITALYDRILKAAFKSGSGGAQSQDIVDDYIDIVSDDIQLEEPLKVVVDAGNGVAGAVAPKLLQAIGANAIPLHCEVDGSFPNHHPDPSVPENLHELIQRVQAEEADLGVAFDGDGDRLGVVTSDGKIIYADRILMMFAMDVLTRNPGGTVIYDVKCTGKLSSIIVGHGGTPLMYKTGHSLIKAKMQQCDAVLGGEMSGHFFFAERWYGFDCGMYAAARLLEVLALDPRSPSAALNQLPGGVCTPELKVDFEEGQHYAYMKAFKEAVSFPEARVTDIDGIRADFADGWGLVRPSNTTPSLVLRFEADTEEALQRIQDSFRTQMTQVQADLALPF